MSKTITIQGVVVEVGQPYTEGHKLTEAEAKALNQVRAENIGNNCRKAIKELLDDADGDASAVTKAAQKMVSTRDKDYVFTLASSVGRATLDPLTKECRSVASEFLMLKLKESGITKKQYLADNGEDAFKEKVAEIMENEQVVAHAKKRLAEREKLATADSITI